MYYIIGSGPSGVSCAYALLRQGRKVTMLDAGLELEAGTQPAAGSLAVHSPAGMGTGRARLPEGRHGS